LLQLIQTAVIAAHEAWSEEWLGDSDILLANQMDRLRQEPTDLNKQPYNHSIAIIQSSGMGKSRLVDSIAKKKFCFPFNIRESIGKGQYSSFLIVLGNPKSDLRCPAYPPSDTNVHSYFRGPSFRIPDDDAHLESRYLAFFTALFRHAASKLETALSEISEGSISERWRQYLAIGASEWFVGRNRRNFYDTVLEEAEKMVRI
jgi:hypothetical protein